jgi:hypothetical protein
MGDQPTTNATIVAWRGPDWLSIRTCIHDAQFDHLGYRDGCHLFRVPFATSSSTVVASMLRPRSLFGTMRIVKILST